MSDLDRFNQLEEPLKSIALAVHARFASIGPELTQRLRWGIPSFTGRKDIAAVAWAGKGTNAHINLQLFMGAHLPDPERLIEGTGKHMRNIKFYALEDLDRPGVDAVIRAAIAYDLEVNG